MNDDSLIQEIDDAMRQERMEKFWEDNRAYIIGFIVLLILSTAVMSGWRSWVERSNAHQTALVMNAMASENPAQQLSQIEHDIGDNHLAIAKMNEAAVHLENAAYVEAVSAFETVAQSGAPSLWRELATILMVRTILDHDAQNASPENLIGLLEPIARNGKSPWSAHAHKYAALVSAELNGDFKGARDWLAPMRGRTDLPGSLLQDIMALDAVFAQKAATQNTSAQEQETPEG